MNLARRWADARLVALADTQLTVINGQRDRLVDLRRQLDESQAALAAANRRIEQQSQRLADIRGQLIDLREHLFRLEWDGINPDLRAFIDTDSRAERGEP